MPDNTFFKKQGGLNLPLNEPETYNIDTPELKRWAIIHFLKSNPKKSCYVIQKATGINHSQVFQILRELVFSRVLVVEKGLDVQGRPIELFSLPKEGGENDK